ncbi:ABC transporter substrate-binding protein [Corynebacterium callunae]|uniref:ABC transporter substrate-binding protein n=1 Tax=Corynebacterium callunae TaxID=1721 RepID=UPI003981A6B3
MKKHKIIFATALVALGLGVSSCSSASSETQTNADGSVDLSNVTLKVGDQIAGTEQVLAASGELDDLPYDIEWSSFTSGPPQIEALNAGQIDFAITGNTPPIIGGPTNTKVVAAYNNQALGDAILISPDSTISSVADLKGKKVAVARGSSAHGHLILQLEKAGVSVDEVELNLLQPSDAKAAFQNGQVDAWAVWDPYTAQAELEGAKILVNAAGVSAGYGFGVASDEALADPAKEAALDDLLDRVAEAYVWAQDNKDEWAEIYAQESGFDPEASKLNTRSLRLQVPLDDEVNTYQNALIGSFVSAGLLEYFDFDTIVDRRFES